MAVTLVAAALSAMQLVSAASLESDRVPASWASPPFLEFPRAAVDVARGEVSLTCIVTTLGRAENCRVEDEDPVGKGFAEAALSAAPGFRFKPTTSAGTAIQDEITFKVVFAQENETRPAQGRRVSPTQERAFGAVDMLGFTSGFCSIHLDDAERQRLEQGADRLRTSSRPLPVFDQVLFGAYGREKTLAADQVVDADYCQSAMEAANRRMRDAEDVIQEVESSLPPQARRSGG